MPNKSLELIELLTWAVVELGKPDNVPVDRRKMGQAIDMALTEAIKAQEREMNATAGLVRISKAMGA